MKTRRGGFRTFEPGSLAEALAAMPPFLLGALSTVVNLLRALYVPLPAWFDRGVGLAVLAVLVIGFIRRIPRWYLPWTGVIGLNLSWILTHRGTFMGFNTRAGMLRPLLGWGEHLFLTIMRGSPWVVRAVLDVGGDWIVLLGLTALGLFVCAIVRPLRPLYARARGDWTLVSFGLYGSAMMAVFYTFEDYPSARYPFIFVSSLVLAAGAWVYLRSLPAATTNRKAGTGVASQRVLALLAALGLAMLLGATGKAVIYASPTWPYPHSFTWHTEALSAVILWLWVIVVVLAPGLLTLLPRHSRESAETNRDHLERDYAATT